MAIIDGDGHVFELRGTAKTMVDYLPDPYRHAKTLAYGVFPEMDHLHNEPVQMIEDAGNQRVVGPAEWSEFLEDVGIEATVMYPTSGLGIGTMPNPDWALAICQAYNDWLHAEYLKVNPLREALRHRLRLGRRRHLEPFLSSIRATTCSARKRTDGPR